MGKEESKSPPPLEKRRVTPSIRKKRKRSQEELIDRPQRRSRRRPKCSDSISIPATPAPSSSIRDSARILSISGLNGRRKHTGSKCNLEEVLSNQTGSVKSTEKQGDKKASNEDGPRHCCCDQHCQACTSITPLRIAWWFLL